MPEREPQRLPLFLQSRVYLLSFPFLFQNKLLSEIKVLKL